MVFKKRNKGTWDGIEKAAVMGTNFVAHTLVGLVLGYFFDYKWFPSLKPWGMLFWLVMGIVAGFRTMYLDAMKVSKSQDLDMSKEESPPETPPAPEEKPGGKAGDKGGQGDA